MVTTRSSQANLEGENPLDPDPLAAIASRLDTLDELRDKVAALEVQSKRQEKQKAKIGSWADESEEEFGRPHSKIRFPQAKIEFPKFSGGDPRGWILQAEKFFRYYGIKEDDKVDIASMYLEGDALDLFSWVNADHTVLYWEELVKALEQHFGPPEYANPDEYLCDIKQTESVDEYRREWARRIARVSNWPEHCQLGVFLSGLKEELRAEIRIRKPRSVYRAASLALEFENRGS